MGVMAQEKRVEKIETKEKARDYYLPAEKRAIARLWQIFDTESQNFGSNQDFRNIILRSLVITRQSALDREGVFGQGSLKELQKDFWLWQKDQVEQGQQSRIKPLNELRKLLGTEYLKNSEAANRQAGDLPFALRKEIRRFGGLAVKTARTERDFNQELGPEQNVLNQTIARTGAEKATAEKYLKLTEEQLIFADIVRALYGNEEAQRLQDVGRLYELLNQKLGFRFGFRDWHDPWFTIANMTALMEAVFQYRRELRKFFARDDNGQKSSTAAPQSVNIVLDELMDAEDENDLIVKITATAKTPNQDEADPSYLGAIARVAIFLQSIKSRPKHFRPASPETDYLSSENEDWSETFREEAQKDDGLSPTQTAGIIAETVIPDEDFYQKMIEELNQKQADFIADLKEEAVFKKKTARQTLEDALAIYDHPFDAIDEINQTLTDLFASRYSAKTAGEMETKGKTVMDQSLIETLAFLRKESEERKLSQEWLETYQQTKTSGSKIDLAQLSKRIAAAEENAGRLSQEINNRYGDLTSTAASPVIEIPDDLELEDLLPSPEGEQSHE